MFLLSDWAHEGAQAENSIWGGGKQTAHTEFETFMLFQSLQNFNHCQSKGSVEAITRSSSLPAYFHLPQTRGDFNTLSLVVQLYLTLFKYRVINAAGTIIPVHL